jgi:ribosomal protein S18 acetylase RimI-like enzyme
MTKTEPDIQSSSERPTPEIRYRPFRNSDPPQLAEIWRARARERGVVQPMSAELFEQLVLAKPYFDNEGLIVALDQEVPVGFVHAAFGPTDDLAGISRVMGVTSMLMVRPDYRRLGIGHNLLARSEEYLRQHGAKVLYGGGVYPLNPFYLGLYGGSELPGVLESDAEAQRLYRSSGYREIDRCVILHRDLADFRQPISRQQMQIRRSTTVQATSDPQSSTWWEACTFGGFDRTRYDLIDNASGASLAHASTWNMDFLAATWGVRAVGLIDIAVDQHQRRQGYATYLLSEIFRRLQAEGVSVVESQTMLRENSAALAMYQKLGFREIDRGIIFRKEET